MRRVLPPLLPQCLVASTLLLAWSVERCTVRFIQYIPVPTHTYNTLCKNPSCQLPLLLYEQSTAFGVWVRLFDDILLLSFSRDAWSPSRKGWNECIRSHACLSRPKFRRVVFDSRYQVYMVTTTIWLTIWLCLYDYDYMTMTIWLWLYDYAHKGKVRVGVHVLTLTHRCNAVRGHRTGSNNSGAEDYLRRKSNKNRR